MTEQQKNDSESQNPPRERVHWVDDSNDVGPNGNIWRYAAVPTSHTEYMHSLTEQLHQIADDWDWCSEFDEAMDEAGLETRSRDRVARVRVMGDFTYSHPSSDVDRAIREDLGQDVAVTTDRIDFSGAVEVDVYFTGRPSGDHDFSDDDIAEALPSSLDCEDLSSWEVLEVN